MKPLGSNEPCWCGSGKKYLRCHQAADSRVDLAIDTLKTGRVWYEGKISNDPPHLVFFRTA